jgi:phytoene dehydrogenase-like protein
MQEPKQIAIIGGGVAGLCAAIYAQRCGYQAEVFEMHDRAGGLATNWRRGDYTFETCLHWLLGSSPGSSMYNEWQEVFDIGKLTFINPPEYVRLENDAGQTLTIYSEPGRLEAELLARAPEDAEQIHALASAARRLASFEPPNPSQPWPQFWLTILRSLPKLPLLQSFSKLSIAEYGQRFKNSLLRSFFSGNSADLSTLALIFSLAWIGGHNGGYAIGGSQAIIRLMLAKLQELGGHIHLAAPVSRILVKNDAAVGIELATGEIIRADWVISAADGHATIYEMLAGRYTNDAIDDTYQHRKTFSSYLQVSLGIARDLSNQGAFVCRVLDSPFHVDPGTDLPNISFRFFHFDPTFAPASKTPVTCFLPTYNVQYWLDLQKLHPVQYQAEKKRIADSAIAVLERRIPGISDSI